MNTKFLKTILATVLAFLTVTRITWAQPPAYFQTVTNLNAAGYWPMHEVEAGVPGDVETNYGSLGQLANGYYPDYSVNVGAFLHQMPGALANDPDTSVFFRGPSNAGTPTNALIVPHTLPLTTLKPPFSLEFWMMATNEGTGQGDIVSQANGYKTAGIRVYYQNNTTGAVNCLLYDGTASGTVVFTASSASNQWHHLVLTCAANTNMSAYFDGVQGGTLGSLAAVAEASKYTPDVVTPFAVGTGLGFARAFSGLVDEVAVYTNVITDIYQHYIDGSSGSAGAYYTDVTNDNPVIYLRMDSSAYTVPAVASWPALVNYGQTNGTLIGNGVYTPGMSPGSVAGAAYKNYTLGLSGANVTPLSGVSSFADAGSAAVYNPTGTNPFTISAFFRGNPVDTNRVQSIVGHGTNSWELGLTVSNLLVFNAGTNSTAVVATGTGPGDLVSIAPYVDGAWHQVVAVHNNTTNVLYVDGVANNTNVLLAANSQGDPRDVLIGSDPCYTNTPVGLGRQFAGQVCEVAFFTNALTTAQVQTLYNNSGLLPVLTLQPASAVLNANVAFTNNVAYTGGSTPIVNHWYYNTVSNYSGATEMTDNARVYGTTTTNLVNTFAQSSDTGYYYFTATNLFGAITSSIASLTVYSVPTFLGQFPVSYTNLITLYGGSGPTIGSTPTFSLSAAGTKPLAYQWMTNGVAVGWGTNASFTFTNCQIHSPTNFYCIVTNIYGPSTSMVWSVTYTAAPMAPFPEAVLAAKPIGFWRLDEPDDLVYDGNDGAICKDYESGNNAIYTNVYLGNVNGGTGYSTTTDPTETAAQFAYYAASASDANAIGPNIDFTSLTNGEFTIAIWANGNSISQVANAGLMAKGYFGGEEFSLDEGATGTALRFEVRSSVGTAYNANSAFKLSNDSSWHFVVGVCDEANASLALYVDGLQVTNIAIPVGSGITNSATVPVMIGARSSTASAPGNTQFRGFLNEAAIYNYPLSAAEILYQFQKTGIAPYFTSLPLNSTNIDYGATLILPLGVNGSTNLSYEWFDVNSNVYIPGQTNATLALAGMTNSDSYYLTVNNSYGSTNSEIFYANVLSGGPQQYADVQNPFYGVQGGVSANSVLYFGTAPIYYQWQYYNGSAWVNLTDNGRISGSQTASLTIANTLPTDAGDYQVVISNAVNSTVSSTAQLIVATVPLNFYTNGLYWTANNSARIANGVLSLTDPNNGGGQGSFFFQVPQYINAFQASFTYEVQPGNNGLADGMSFCLQDDPRGPAAIGGAGGQLGVGGVLGQIITPSAELMMDIFGGSGYAFGTNGLNVPTAGATSPNFTSPGTVQLNGGDPINVTVNYANSHMSLAFTDTVTTVSYNTAFAVPNLTQVLGTNTAYVGFTGSYGGQNSVQTIQNFTFISLAMEAISLQNGTNTLIAWPGSIVGYVLQKNNDLNTPNWVNVTNADIVTNNLNEVIVPMGATNTFYRLELPPLPQ